MSPTCRCRYERKPPRGVDSACGHGAHGPSSPAGSACGGPAGDGPSGAVAMRPLRGRAPDRRTAARPGRRLRPCHAVRGARARAPAGPWTRGTFATDEHRQPNRPRSLELRKPLHRPSLRRRARLAWKAVAAAALAWCVSADRGRVAVKARVDRLVEQKLAMSARVTAERILSSPRKPDRMLPVRSPSLGWVKRAIVKFSELRDDLRHLQQLAVGLRARTCGPCGVRPGRGGFGCRAGRAGWAWPCRCSAPRPRPASPQRSFACRRSAASRSPRHPVTAPGR
jgi:hypothetical protein